MNRFFYAAGQRQGNEVTLSGEDARHLLRVLRATAGDTVELCDGQGACHRADIISVSKENVFCRLTEPLRNNETNLRVDLAFSLLKGEKTDFVLQKATEAGVAGFLPFVSERTVARPVNKGDSRRERWEKVARAAAAQSKRAIIPQVAAPFNWAELLEKIPAYHRAVLFWEAAADKPLSAILRGIPANGSILLITGPEGGFSGSEVRLAEDKGAYAATLGPRILRAETAALVAVVVALYQAGEMG